MDAVLSGLRWETCLAYLDDIIVFGRTWEKHLLRLQEVRQCIRDARLKLKPSKCMLARHSIEFLGHIFSPDSLDPSPSKLQAIQDLTPSDIREIRAFIGLASFYRRFVKNFTQLAYPLYQLTQKDTPFHWSTECQQAFTTLKNHLTSAPVVTFPEYTLPFCLYTDFSLHAIGAVLAQVRDDKEHIIACASRALNSTKINYAGTKREWLGVIWALQHFWPYTAGAKTPVITDH